MKVTAVIPARMGSTRLARKVLAPIHGFPMLWHVWQRVCQARLITDVIIATDSVEIVKVVEEFGGHAEMTSPNCRSGTERIAALSHKLDSDLILNVQGDEPLVAPEMLDHLIEAWQSKPSGLVTPIFRIQSLDELLNPNVVKVVRALDGSALYFSRSAVPFVRDYPQADWLHQQQFWGHIGVYGYAKETLVRYPSLPESPLEEAERLEQLRFLEAGFICQTIESTYRPIAVDTAADLERVRKLLENAFHA
jgi:3-deoxy-manno-octulosonate cytidylyltransferase (CMP-KDO synthetase)